jgi:hypothetical protein
MQTLPYIVLTNDHLSHVYELYYRAFERFRKVPEVKTIEDNDKFCAIVKETLKEHLTVIPRLVIGVIEVQDYMKPDSVDKFVTTLLRSVSGAYQCYCLMHANDTSVFLDALSQSNISRCQKRSMSPGITLARRYMMTTIT